MLGLASGVGAQRAPSDPQASFMVFFDCWKGEVRSDEAATHDKIPEAFRANPSARLTFSGHTDRSGSTSTNRGTVLSRAGTIRGELENRGILRNAMSVVSFGEGQPLVPTGDGVREVLNRRVATKFGE